MSFSEKKLIGSIYLLDEKAVYGLKDDKIINDDAVKYAFFVSDSDVDEIIVFDKSTGDDQHEKALDVIKNICKASDVPVIGAGNVKRMEDIKKLLYAGCKKAVLNFSKKENIEILVEVSEKFGKDKIIACCKNFDEYNGNRENIEKYASGIIFLNPLNDYKEDDFSLPVTILDNVNSADSPCGLFEKASFITGVGGNLINDNLDRISEFKKICREKGFEISSLKPAFSWADLKKNNDGMVPVIVQDYRTDQVLMLAYMNEEAYNKTLETGKMTYFSRSRSSLWLKGETSGHFQYVKALYADCDLDTILAKVKQVGAACHTGSYSCFFNEIASREYTEKNPQKVLDNVFEVIKDRKVNPRQGSYTNYLFDKGIDKILKKVGEEATEMVIAAKNPGENEIVYEMSDFLYHMMVLMAEKNVSWEDITDELSRR
ncbi:MAG: bifunctional phosphoribosyl-AMP cyclohydrolase/phosphoribosyl-ATP diphosphatase HisIE [Butyrivibrio sp.]|nr:bifunctional phosphoribosyl-AMP cyclohydrolase/phosphoribosyl-ATP diphosphatase HisIE [Butyrivibrio sp.]